MTTDNTGADEGNNKGRFELNPVDPKSFDDTEASTVPDEGDVDLTADEIAAWQSQIAGENFSMFPAMEYLREDNIDLMRVIAQAIKYPGTIDDREEVRFSIKEAKENILDNLQDTLTDMQKFMRSASSEVDEYVGGYVEYATGLIYELTIARVVALNDVADDSDLRPIKRKKLSRIISRSIVQLDNEDDMPEVLTDICESLLDDEINYIRKVLKEAYRNHDTEQIAANLAEAVKLLGVIATKLDSTDRDI